ncbi:uncharacterized protein FN964_006554 isoform 2-T7 [Alca torda]
MLSCFFYDVKIELIYTGILIAKNAAIIQGAKGNPSIRQPKRFSRAVLCVLRLESEPFLQRRMKFGMKAPQWCGRHLEEKRKRWPGGLDSFICCPPLLLLLSFMQKAGTNHKRKEKKLMLSSLASILAAVHHLQLPVKAVVQFTEPEKSARPQAENH